MDQAKSIKEKGGPKMKYMRNIVVVLSVSAISLFLIIVNGCATAEGKTYTYNVSYEQMWDKVLSVLKRERFMLTSANKDIGVITTDYIMGKTVDVPALFRVTCRYKYQIAFEKISPSQTRVDIISKVEEKEFMKGGSAREAVEQLKPFEDITHTRKGKKYASDVETWLNEHIAKSLEFIKQRNYYLNKGLDNLKQRNYHEAIKDYDKAIELDPGEVRAYISRGATYSALGNHQQAIKDWDKAIELDPKNPKAFASRGVEYSHLGNYQEAIKDSEKAIEIDPGLVIAHYNIACYYSFQNNAAMACQWLKKVIEKGYNDWEHLKSDKDFDNIRNTPCFQEIIKSH